MTLETRIPRVQDLGGVFLVDTRHAGRAGTVGSYVIPFGSESFALVETGPGSTLEELERGIAELGLDLADLEHILLTHIHLDHAGAAGELARRSGAIVHVHHRGAPHLEDPARLIDSARRVYGDAMDALWGDMTPVPHGQLRPLYDGDLVRLGRIEVEALDTPGHARHHMCYILGESLFTGDAAGVRFPPATLIRPALPPPETDLEAWEASLAKMRACVPERLLLTHFGEVLEAEEHLAAVADRNRQWAEEARRGLMAGESTDELRERIAELQEREFADAGLDDAFAERYRVTSDAAMTAMGLERYWRRNRPEALE